MIEQNRRNPSRHIEKMSGDGILLDNLLGHIRHSITSNRLDVTVFQGRLDRAVNPPHEKWVALRNLDRLPVTAITRKALCLKH